MAKTISSAVFGVDMRNSLLIFICVSALFRLFGFPTPSWPWSLLGIATAINYGLLPNIGQLLYPLIVKRRMRVIHVIGAVALALVVSVGLWFKILGYLILAIAVGLGWWVAVANAQKVRDRASHWPILHYPVPVLILSALYSGLLAQQFTPDYIWYVEMLTVLPLVAHFGHECMKEGGFPLLSLTQDMARHWRIYRLQPFKMRRVPLQVTRRFYAKQAANLQGQTDIEDLLRRADEITTGSVFLFFFLVAASCLEGYILG